MKLDCRKISFAYPGTGKAIINELSFSINTPGFHCLFGPSGVGKTSLARIIAGLVEQDCGTISLEHLDTVLYSYNLERLPGWLSIGQHLEMVCAKEKIPLKDQLINAFEIEHVMASTFSSLSMGQQNRINLIRYLLEDFDLLVMDESLANVDEALRSSIIGTIKSIFPDKMFLYISHHLLEVSKFCSQILVLGRTCKANPCVIVEGLNLQQGDNPDPLMVDQVMLEIMNAF